MIQSYLFYRQEKLRIRDMYIYFLYTYSYQPLSKQWHIDLEFEDFGAHSAQIHLSQWPQKMRCYSVQTGGHTQMSSLHGTDTSTVLRKVPNCPLWGLLFTAILGKFSFVPGLSFPYISQLRTMMVSDVLGPPKLLVFCDSAWVCKRIRIRNLGS
jgi:hypothetical protein